MTADSQLLVRATLRLYRDCAIRALHGMKKVWPWIFLPLGWVVVISVVSPIFGIFGMAGGFLLGLLTAFAFAQGLAVVRAASRSEKTSWALIWKDAGPIFLNVLTIGFILWILSLVLGSVLTSPDARWLLMASNLALIILFNPIPEIVNWISAAGRESPFSMFGAAFEFMKENWIEWLFPQLVLLLPLFVAAPAMTMATIAHSSFFALPGNLVAVALFVVGASSLVTLAVAVIFGVFLTFFILTFRLNLYRELSTSNRRKRIFAAKYE